MKMALPVRLAIVFAMVALVPILNNNCSDMKFDTAKESVQSSGTDVPRSEEEVINTLPPGEIDIYRPISDIRTNPDLVDLYGCGDGGVMICHFPESDDAFHTICIGMPALDTHEQHQVTATSTGSLTEMHDYLGPCKHHLNK